MQKQCASARLSSSSLVGIHGREYPSSSHWNIPLHTGRSPGSNGVLSLHGITLAGILQSVGSAHGPPKPGHAGQAAAAAAGM